MKLCKCGSNRIISISGKTSDCFTASYKNIDYDGYIPSNIGIGDGGDYIEFDYCLECGQIQGEFPILERHVKEEINNEY